MVGNQRVTAVLLAAGSGNRMGAGIPKQYRNIDGEPMLQKAMNVFLKLEQIDEVWLVVREEELDFCESTWLGRSGCEKLKRVIAGGKERQDSVLKALCAIDEDEAPDWILIHDAARPYITQEAITRLLDAFQEADAAVLAVPVNDTVKVVSNDVVITTPDRSTLYAVQTPQGFSFPLLLSAYQKATTENFRATDDAQVVEHAGHSVRIVKGDYANRKVTTKEDMEPHKVYQTGQGIDVHAFAEGRKLVIGGVEIPHHKGLLGHSDADVLIHAIMDALLGACGLGDIGEHFSDQDPAYRGISSLVLLEAVFELLQKKGATPCHIDATIIGEKPKMAPFKNQMRGNIASALHLAVEKVNIKATTTEKLGFCGREEGLAAMATATVSLIEN